MDKNSIKKYAIWAREELIRRVSIKAEEYGISKGNIVDAGADSIDGRLLSAVEKAQRQRLISQVQKDGYDQVIETVAYTWFNRFIALRFMEVNGVLPSHVRVFTDENNTFHPQILTEAIHLELDGLNLDRVIAMKQANEEDSLYKYLLITQCNALSAVLPKIFQKIQDCTELLFPDHILREGSVIHRMISDIPEEDWKDQVQIVGWLYQYYNAELKDETFALLKKNVKITKERLPAATQLFTPDWIVRYMVENSLGRLWVEGHPNDDLKAGWKYYLEEAEQQPEVQAQLEQIRKEYAALNPEEIKLIDPCMGSGHILVYAFDVLMQIYLSQGWSERDAAQSIIQHNLYGLDIDERAAQLAYFAVMMKARQYDRRFFSRGIQPQVFCTKGDAEGPEFGSLLAAKDPGPRPEQQDLFGGNEDSWNYRNLLAQKYHVVVTNPPYMGASNMNSRLSEFIKKNYSDYKSDFFSAFMVRCTSMAKPNGYLGFFTPYVWMFIQSYEKLRHLICESKTIETLIQFEYSAFEEATVPVCTFVLRNSHVNKKGCYFRLTDFKGGMEVQRQKTLEAIENHACGYYYEQTADNFSKIPGSPVAYWVRNFQLFENQPLGSIIDARIGMVSGDNERFLRLWHEVEWDNIEFFAKPHKDPKKLKWYPLQKGGEFRHWYGNIQYIINWENDGDELKNDNFMGSRVRSHNYNGKQQFKEGITWNSITSGTFHCRYTPEGYTFDAAGPLCEVIKKEYLFYVLALLTSKVSTYLFSLINPTINFPSGYLESLPLVISEVNTVDDLARECIKRSCADWDSYETSWNFKRHPMV